MSRPDGLQQRFFGAAKRISPGQRIASMGLPVFAWHRPDARERYLGYGVEARHATSEDAASLSAIEGAAVHWMDPASGVPGPWFGGFSFDAQRPASAEWRSFGSSQWVLPRVAIAEGPGGAWLLAFARDEAEARARLEAAELVAPASAGAGLPELEHRAEDRQAWSELMERALGTIRSGELRKVVLARTIGWRAGAEVDADQLFEALVARHPRCAVFLFRAESGASFVGASPETLLRREGELLHVDALAGTLAPDSQEATSKERHEHDLVVEGIREALRPVCSWVETDAAPSLHPVGALTHLKTRVVGRLRPGDGVGEAARALHPTPALGGTPTGLALSFLRVNEGFDRGWYGGGVGWVGPSAAHLAVAIRSTLVDGRAGTAFVGAGIVEGSDADAEWQETVRKSQAVLGVFGGAA